MNPSPIGIALLIPHRPKSDTCKTCDSFKVKVEAEGDPAARARLEAQWEVHKRKAERAYQQLREDTALAAADPDVDMLTFDLEQSLATPLISTNVVFYKRQLWTYNLGIHCAATGKGYMHMWDESVASRGSQEVASCLYKHLNETASSATHLVLYSDACGGQNRNINLLCFLLYVVATPDFSYESIDHKFMVSGHSYLPNDRDFGSMESIKCHTQHVFTPDEWRSLVADARRRNPFCVREMKQQDFKAMDTLTEYIVNRKFTTKKEKVEWLKMRWIRVQKSEPLRFKYRTTHNDLEEWKEVDLKPKRAGRPSNMARASFQPLYEKPRAISSAKLSDLMELLDYIPPIYHSFYKNLLANDDQVEEVSDSSQDESD